MQPTDQVRSTTQRYTPRPLPWARPPLGQLRGRSRGSATSAAPASSVIAPVPHHSCPGRFAGMVRACRRSEERHPPTAAASIGVRQCSPRWYRSPAARLDPRSDIACLLPNFASIRRGWDRFLHRPPTARALALSSTMNRSKSIRSAERRWFNKIWCIFSQTPGPPASRRGGSRQVMPQPQPIS